MANLPRQNWSSFVSLWDLVESLPDDDLRKQLAPCVDDIVVRVRPLRNHRDKRIAHCDLDHGLGEENVLPTIDRETVDAGLEAICELMEPIDCRYRDELTVYAEPITPPGKDWIIFLLAFAQCST